MRAYVYVCMYVSIHQSCTSLMHLIRHCTAETSRISQGRPTNLTITDKEKRETIQQY